MAYLISLWTAHHTLCQRYTLISSKITNLGHRVSPGNVTLCHPERHPLMLECLITSCRCIRMIVSASDSVSWSPHDQHYVFSTKRNSQKLREIANLGHRFSPGNVTLWHLVRYPLLLHYILSFLGCISMIVRASDSISDPLMGNTVSFLSKTLSIFKQKYTNFGHQISPGNVMLWQKYRHPLLLECFLFYLGYMNIIRRAFNSISNPLMVNAGSFYQNKFKHLKQIDNFWAPDQPRKCDTVAGI